VNTLKNIRILKNAGILADRTPKSESLEFLKYNLVYGFNGTGKTTLSRILASLETGKHNPRLLMDCEFEVDLDDGTRLACPKSLAGLEERICVFNKDFVENHLRWADGRANPIFYISREQADAAEELKKLEKKLPEIETKLDGENKLAEANKKALQEFKRDRARLISQRLREGNRKYEAPNLTSDYETLELDATAILPDDKLDSVAAVCAQTSAGTEVNELQINFEDIASVIRLTGKFAHETAGSILTEDLVQHPSMVPWAREGFEYHEAWELGACLFCGNEIPGERRKQLAGAFNAKLQHFVNNVQTAKERASALGVALNNTKSNAPDSGALSPDLRAAFSAAKSDFQEHIEKTIKMVLQAEKMLSAKLDVPTASMDDTLPMPAEFQENINSSRAAMKAINYIIARHNEVVLDFDRHQSEARLCIRKHYLTESKTNYENLIKEKKIAQEAADKTQSTLDDAKEKIRELKLKVQTHGPAAAAINSLVRTYLGHDELTISAVDEGYELHRYGQLVRGEPSEGEKTAIALCYFISTLPANDRKLKDLIVVVDDPISSLDTKAMNFACSMIRHRLEEAAQLFVFTHNQNCMNEFKKAWKNWAREDAKETKARLFFIDVKKPADGGSRNATLIKMSKLLREHDSEYHFLVQKVLQFELDGLECQYAFMMPNVMRRVLDVFLSFRIPKPGTIKDKLDALSKSNSDLEGVRLYALERLSQVESHSDNLDDLVTHSSMTIEEAHDANAALLELMDKTDSAHLNVLRNYCKPDA